MYTYMLIENMILIAGLLEETREVGKEEENDRE
jgi:hypothetical protein